MAAGYEVLEPWYEHLYASLHAVLRSQLTPPADVAQPRALDAGLGTGLQTAILDEMGYAVHGLDLSRKLLRAARKRFDHAPLVQGDVQALPYRDGSFEAASCCGSVLSYVDDARQALAEIARVLRPGGRLLIECEGRSSLDLGWAWLSSLFGDPWRYGSRPSTYPARRDDTARSGVPAGISRLWDASALHGERADAAVADRGARSPSRLGRSFDHQRAAVHRAQHRPRLGRPLAAAYRNPVRRRPRPECAVARRPSRE